MSLKLSPINLTTIAQPVYTCPAGSEASVHGLVFSNITSNVATITLQFYKASSAITYTLGAGISVSANSTYTWPRPVNMQPGDCVIALASANSTIFLAASIYESSTIYQGFNVIGTWNSATTYAINDVVSTQIGTLVSSWVATAISTNQAPATGSSYWVPLLQPWWQNTGTTSTFVIANTTNASSTNSGAGR